MLLKDIEDFKEVFEQSGAFILKRNYNLEERKLTSLEGCPKNIYGNISFFGNELTSLKGIEKSKIDGYLLLTDNKIVNLDYFPEIGASLFCNFNKLTSLKGIQTHINGELDCSNNQIKSLEYSPTVTRNFNCSNNEIKSLKDIKQKIINGYFNCSKNKIESLEDCPEEVTENFICSDNKLISLENGPKIVGSCYERDKNELITLKGVPENIKSNFICSSNKLTSLEYSPKRVGGNYDRSDNDLKTLEHAKNIKIGGYFNCHNNRLTNIREQIIKYQIRATDYLTDEGDYTFESIKEEFLSYKTKLKEEKFIKNQKKKIQIKKEKLKQILKLKNEDYGLSI